MAAGLQSAHRTYLTAPSFGAAAYPGGILLQLEDHERAICAPWREKPVHPESFVTDGTIPNLVEPEYVGWTISTKLNSGAARITGFEFNVRHSLRQLGRWGRFFTVFANGTKLNLQGSAQANFSSFIPKSANWGVSFNHKRLTVMAKWNYRGLDKRVARPAFGPDGYEYIGARTKLDLNVAYQLTGRLSAIFSAVNVTNEPHTFYRYGSETPAYARKFSVNEYGVPFSIGIKGTY